MALGAAAPAAEEGGEAAMEEAEEEVEVGEELGEELGEEAGDVADDAARAHAALADASAAAPARPPKLVHQRYRRLRIDLLACKYDAVWRAAREMGWTPLEPDEADSDEWHVFWTDNSVSQERVMRMRPMQRINHFPGMLELARKAGTARNLNRMLKAFPHEYKIFPATWMLPADLVDFKAQFNGRKNKTFIVKPSRGCQGKDILLTRSMEGINLHENYIAQRYLHRPYLLDGFKFDLRLYVLITCVEPLRVYVYREGMVRLCTHKYGPVKANNLEDQCMHLTNYAINKQDEGYTPAASEADERAHKRLLSTVLERLEGCGENTAALSYAIDDVIVKSIIAVQPHLERTYYSCQQRTEDAGSSCFELLGVDVLLDHRLKPYLLEVNHSPSFAVDTPLDDALKSSVLSDTMAMASFSRDEVRLLRRLGKGRVEPAALQRLRQMRAAYEDERVGRTNFARVYPDGPSPPPGVEPPRYDEYLRVARELHAVSALAGTRRASVAQPEGAGAAEKLPQPQPPGAAARAPGAAGAAVPAVRRCTPPDSSAQGRGVPVRRPSAPTLPPASGGSAGPLSARAAAGRAVAVGGGVGSGSHGAPSRTSAAAAGGSGGGAGTARTCSAPPTRPRPAREPMPVRPQGVTQGLGTPPAPQLPQPRARPAPGTSASSAAGALATQQMASAAAATAAAAAIASSMAASHGPVRSGSASWRVGLPSPPPPAAPAAAPVPANAGLGPHGVVGRSLRAPGLPTRRTATALSAAAQLLAANDGGGGSSRPGGVVDAQSPERVAAVTAFARALCRAERVASCELAQRSGLSGLDRSAGGANPSLATPAGAAGASPAGGAGSGAMRSRLAAAASESVVAPPAPGAQ